MKAKQYRLCEVVADIAYIAGLKKYYSGDSRIDMDDFISWAEEFEKKWKGKKWGEDDTQNDYILEVEKFTDAKIKQAKKDYR